MYAYIYVILRIFIYLFFAVSTFVSFANSQREICEISTYIILNLNFLFSFSSHHILAVLILILFRICLSLRAIFILFT